MSIQFNKPQFMIKAHFYIEYIRKTDSIISQKKNSKITPLLLLIFMEIFLSFHYLNLLSFSLFIALSPIPFSPLNQNLTNELLSKAQLPYTKN